MGGKAVGQNRTTKNCGRESVLIDCLNLIWIKISKNGIKFLIAVLFKLIEAEVMGSVGVNKKFGRDDGKQIKGHVCVSFWRCISFSMLIVNKKKQRG